MSNDVVIAKFKSDNDERCSIYERCIQIGPSERNSTLRVLKCSCESNLTTIAVLVDFVKKLDMKGFRNKDEKDGFQSSWWNWSFC